MNTNQVKGTAKDIAGLGSDYYLNLKGSPLGDTCVYARSFAVLKRAGKAPVVTYAHIARERGYSGFALQFFFSSRIGPQHHQPRTRVCTCGPRRG